MKHKKGELHEFILKYRKSLTSVEEREFIKTEKSLIRMNLSDMKTYDKGSSMLKLCWMAMMGVDTEFSQIECLNAISDKNSRLKILAYFCVSMTMTKNSELLLFLANQIRNDLKQNEDYLIQAASLKIFSELSDEIMARDLNSSIIPLISNNSKYIKKKVLIAMIKTVSLLPELSEQMADCCEFMIKENNIGVLLAGYQLCAICGKNIANPSDIFNSIILDIPLKIGVWCRKGDLEKIQNPFLMCLMLSLLREEINRREINSIGLEGPLLSLYQQIQLSKTSSSLTILSEISKTILSIESGHTLRKTAINILSTFLEHRNKIYIFSALKLLEVAAIKDPREVGKYQSHLKKAINDSDIDIKRAGLSVLKATTNHSNIIETIDIIEKQLKLIKSETDLEKTISMAQGLLLEFSPTRLFFVRKSILLSFYQKSSDSNSNFRELYSLISHDRKTAVSATFLALEALPTLPQSTKNNYTKHILWILGEGYRWLIRALFGQIT